MTRRRAKEASAGKRGAVRKEVTRSADLLQLLRHMAGASPELAGFAFMCGNSIETIRAECAPIVPTDAAQPSEASPQASEPNAQALLNLPSAQAHVIRVPLLPTRPLSRERKMRRGQ